MQRFWQILGLALSLTNLTPSLGAATNLTQALTVSSTVPNVCTLTTTPTINFPVYDPNSTTNVDTTGILSIACTKGTSNVTIALNLGSNPSAGLRRMRSSNNYYLNYEIYTDSTMSVIWNDTNNKVALPTPTTKDPQNVYIYGRIPFGQNVPPGNYADNIQITVYY